MNINKKRAISSELSMLEEAEVKLHDMEQDPAAYWSEECYKAYDSLLDECTVCPKCGVGGASWLNANDPIAYRCGFADYFEGETAEQFAKEQSKYQELKEALVCARDTYEEFQDAIAELDQLL